MIERTLDYDGTLAELLGLIGRSVRVYVSTLSTPPTLMAVLEGVLARGAESPVMKASHALGGAKLGDHVMFQVGDSAFFPLVRTDFVGTYVSEDGIRMIRFRDFEVGVSPIAD